MSESEPENEPDLVVTSGGIVLTESDIYELAREAEKGYELDKLRPRRRTDPDESSMAG
jgi:hypothetical protein